MDKVIGLLPHFSQTKGVRFMDSKKNPGLDVRKKNSDKTDDRGISNKRGKRCRDGGAVMPA